MIENTPTKTLEAEYEIEKENSLLISSISSRSGSCDQASVYFLHEEHTSNIIVSLVLNFSCCRSILTTAQHS